MDVHTPVAWMAFNDIGACELFIERSGADDWAGDNGYAVGLFSAPSSTVLTRPIVLDTAGSALFVAKVQADALRGIAAEIVEELSKRPKTRWGEIIAGLREAADRVEAAAAAADSKKAKPACRECGGRGWVDDLEEYADTGRRMRTWCHLCGGDILSPSLKEQERT